MRAVFVGAYNKSVERLDNKSNQSLIIEETHSNELPVPFYNWLTERDNLPQSIVQSELSLDNWLEVDVNGNGYPNESGMRYY
ncbi:hypothetical protein [Lysinibacillus sp. ZYM-1]|uniref:hypothetical protein n=1 Tax=Lysinibacillus sp. ZYM-1 TaxID=1681184 RepID=UPI0006CE9B71|nr:hypothetical protein [Lysinibacillus sp. ZYM-1]KPN96877.1 hypothetical protein AO843_00905 [Lysinibacillus sp. ZYM-1]